MYWSFAVRVTGPVEEQGTSGLPGIGLTRTRCSKCQQSVCDWGDKLITPLAFPSAEILNMKPTMNIFYDSGIKKETMGLKTIYGDAMSFIIPAFPILTIGVPQLFVLLFKWIKVTLVGGNSSSSKEVKND